MDFRLTTEQELLRESGRRFFAEQTPADDAWAQFAEFGWLQMPVPQTAGGLGASLADIAILCEEMGRGPTAAPFIGGAILPAGVVARCAHNERNQKLLTDIAENRTRMAVAAFEADRRYELSPGARAVVMADGSQRLSGHKTVVAGGAQAEQLIVSAQTEDPEKHSMEPALYLLDVTATGVDRRVYDTISGATVADFTLDRVSLTPPQILASGHTALGVLQDAMDDAALCLCAQAVGCMDRAIELTADYLHVRKQFGRALADFQVLQHSVAEMSVDANSARAMLYRALAFSGAPRAQRRKAVSGCVIKVMQVAKSVTNTAVHLHGGIGMTCEYAVGHCLRWVLAAERQFGDSEYHLARYLAL